MSIVVKAGKVAKKLLRSAGLLKSEHRVSYVRRIERIHTDKRICAMTFDDGPMNMPASPDRSGGRAMTDLLLDALAKYSAHATFDIVGSTEENYPDKSGALGSAAWGGVKFDHYPDIGCDALGGAVHAPELVKRMLDEGHELANHGYRHIIFGKKPFVYGAREHFETIDEAVADLTRLHKYVRDNFGYEMKLSRPPHYVDSIAKGLTSYDAYALMGYGYMAASYDGGGWLPAQSADAEIDAMVNVIKNALEADPDVFKGQIIFGKDGYNMAKRTPVAYALEKQLDLLYKYGYRVVSVSELISESPFSDVGRECEIFEKLCKLEKAHAVAYTDNMLRLDKPMTNFEYAMLMCPREITVNERIEKIVQEGRYISEYDTALAWAKASGTIDADVRGGDSVKRILGEDGDITRSDGFTRYEALARVNAKTLIEIKA
ncbi:MAG: polysaccharide deacetylase family protein [Clostridia bacterium]|nr:polysaccharide deacetylase family protein [Clostridia bacterium]